VTFDRWLANITGPLVRGLHCPYIQNLRNNAFSFYVRSLATSNGTSSHHLTPIDRSHATFSCSAGDF